MVSTIVRLLIFLIILLRLFSYFSFWSIVCFFIRPRKADGAGSSGGLNDSFIGFAIKIRVICNVFVEHVFSKTNEYENLVVSINLQILLGLKKK